MTLTYYERGQLAALRRTALAQLEAKFGAISQPARERLETFSIGQLDQLLKNLVKTDALKDLGLGE